MGMSFPDAWSQEVALARRGGGFKSDKRRKELTRLKKQEEKRQRRFSGKTEQETDAEVEGTEEIGAEETENTEEQEKDPE